MLNAKMLEKFKFDIRQPLTIVKTDIQLITENSGRLTFSIILHCF